MLYLIFCYAGITCICLWVGFLFYSFLTHNWRCQKTFFHILITGLFVVTSIGQWIVLISPLTAVSLFFISCLGFLVTFFRWKRMKETYIQCIKRIKGRNFWFFISLSCFALMILVLNAGPTLMDDTDSYHVQMIKWIQEYGSVHGIANLHLRFGFNSSWFSSIGLFSYPVSGLNSYISLNGLLSIWFCFFLLEKLYINFDFQEAIKLSNLLPGLLVLLLLCLVNWPMIRGSSCSANYDFIGTCCITVLFIDLYNENYEVPVEWLIWPAYLFTVRMMNFPLLILSLIYIVNFLKSHSLQRLLFIFLFCGFIIIPFLIRNIILSGYLFFPVYQLDFFSFDWKVDKMRLIEITNYIRNFNRINPMFQSMSVTEKLNFPNWIPAWYKYLFRFDKLILTLSIFGYVLQFFILRKMKNRLYRVFLFTMVCQLISWFFIGPDPRFVYGPLLFGIFVAITNLPTMKVSWVAITKYSVLLTSFLVLIYGVTKVIREDEYRNFIIPRPLPVPVVRTIVVGHIQMHIPERILNNWNPRCYDIELPCLYKLDPRLEARGDKISDGFRLKKQSKYIFNGGEYKITE